MTPNPFFGVMLHWLGGLASASFYIPYRGVRRWSWETYWLVGGFFSWIIAPILLASLLVPGLFGILAHAEGNTLFWAYFWGAMWGIGGLTFGLTMRYLGIALGMSVALGFCSAFGTLVPPIFKGEFGSQILGTTSGRIILLGVIVCLLGIGVSGLAGMSKEREMPEEEKRKTVKEFNFVKGLSMAVFSGVMSSCFSYGLTAGSPIAALTRKAIEEAHGNVIWQNLPVLVVVLLGGFTTNFIWCIILNVKNGSGREYLAPTTTKSFDAVACDSHGAPGASAVAVASQVQQVPLLSNYLFSAVAGVTWYLQFFFYSMGETQMGQYGFASWTLHMASIIIFSTLWGVALKEWAGSSKRTQALVALGLAVLVGSTLIIGYGMKFSAAGGGH